MDISTNGLFIGAAMLMLNLGAKHIHADLGKVHEQILSNEYVKKVIIFCMFFVATRNISTAFLLTIFYVIIIDGILHEKRRFCLIPKKYLPTPNATPTVPPNVSVNMFPNNVPTVMPSIPQPAPILVNTNNVIDKSNYINYVSNLSKLN